MAELKRNLMVLLVCLALPLASAQGVFYLGFRSSAITPLYSTNAPLLLGLQLGVPLTERLGVRAALDAALFFRSVIQADLLYSQPLGGGVRWYVGAGPTILPTATSPALTPGRVTGFTQPSALKELTHQGFLPRCSLPSPSNPRRSGEGSGLASTFISERF